MKHIFLIGYRGSGKSTIGRGLARELKRDFVDTDDVIEATSGITIREIFASESERGFRDREQAAIATVSANDQATVIALGGGAILRDANQQQISRSGSVIYLKASPESLFERIEADTATAERRPNLTSSGGYAEVVSVLEFREPIYSRLAQKIVLTDGRTPDDIVAEIAAWANRLD